MKGRFPWKSYHVTQQVSPSVFQIEDGGHQHSSIDQEQGIKNIGQQKYNLGETQHEYYEVKESYTTWNCFAYDGNNTRTED